MTASSRLATRRRRPTPAAVAAAMAVSWFAMLAHNEADLPIPPWAVENTGPMLVAVALVVAYALRPTSRTIAMALLMWGLLNAVVGGIVTVLPLPFLPFVPEQSVTHYAWHVVYTSGQIPLIWFAIRAARSTSAPQ